MKKKSKNGEWIYNGNHLITGYAPYKCSKCGIDFHLRTPFCPYCGDKKIIDEVEDIMIYLPQM